MTLKILCEDGPLIAVNKPAGLLTQGVPHGLPSLEHMVKDYLRQKYNKPGNVYLGVPHRLDRPVSGIVIFARNSKAAARLAEQFRDRTVEKCYLAVVKGVPSPASGRLTDWLLKDAEAAHVTLVSPDVVGAKQAILDYRVLAHHEGRSLVEVQLQTGRMHQIRVQFGSRGWPIIGDTQYGAATEPDWPEVMIALHARRLRLRHPVRYDEIVLEAPIPAEWGRFPFGDVVESAGTSGQSPIVSSECRDMG